MNDELPHLILGALHDTLNPAFRHRIRTPWEENLAILRLDAIQRIASRRKVFHFRFNHHPKISGTGASKLQCSRKL